MHTCALGMTCKLGLGYAEDGSNAHDSEVSLELTFVMLAEEAAGVRARLQPPSMSMRSWGHASAMANRAFERNLLQLCRLNICESALPHSEHDDAVQSPDQRRLCCEAAHAPVQRKATDN